MKQYNDLVKKILAEGELRHDRTGVGTLAIFGGQIEFDLREGFPLVTSKETRWKTAFLETLWFLRGDTSVRWLNENGSKLWDAWADETGSIKDGYGPQWRKTPANGHNVKLIPRRYDRDADYRCIVPAKRDAVASDFNGDGWWAVGKEVIHGRAMWEIQFDSGFIATVTGDRLRTLYQQERVHELDGFKAITVGGGYMGNPVPWATKRMKMLWLELMNSCYNPAQTEKYFGKTATVSAIWHSFEMFCKTLCDVPRFRRWKAGENLVLNCSYFGSNVYSPNTCMFLTADEAAALKVPRPVRVGGKNYESIEQWAYANDIDLYAAQDAWRRNRDFKGVQEGDILYLEPTEHGVWRRELVVDQVAAMIDSLKYNRHGRRHIVNAWTSGDIQDMALPPCHVMHQCFVSDDGYLDMVMYQRSWDVALGAPFNIAGYALLMHLYCRAVGDLKPRHLKIAYGDAHLYSNHLDEMRRIADLPLPESKPELVFHTFNTDIDGYKMSDFEIQGYVSNPFVKLEVAV